MYSRGITGIFLHVVARGCYVTAGGNWFGSAEEAGQIVVQLSVWPDLQITPTLLYPGAVFAYLHSVFTYSSTVFTCPLFCMQRLLTNKGNTSNCVFIFVSHVSDFPEK